MRNVLVTGGAGFIGSHLVDLLLDRGYAVTILDDLSTGRQENIQHHLTHPDLQFVQGDVCDEALLDRLMPECELVFHLAAVVGVQRILKDPVHVIETNNLGTRAVLYAAVRHKCRVLLTSTASVYGKNDRLPYREDDVCVMGPTTNSRWCYAMSKAVNELMALGFQKKHGLPVTIVRPFNTIGVRQSDQYGHVVPHFVRQALRGQPLTVYGDGSQQRCFCDVRDVVRALVDLIECDKAVSQLYNVGTTEEISILELAHTVLSMVDEHTNRSPQPQDTRITFVPYDKAYRPGFEEMYRRIPDTTKIQTDIGWQPRYVLRDTLSAIIANEHYQWQKETQQRQPSAEPAE